MQLVSRRIFLVKIAAKQTTTDTVKSVFQMKIPSGSVV
jgi:hypothetical protein